MIDQEMLAFKFGKVFFQLLSKAKLRYQVIRQGVPRVWHVCIFIARAQRQQLRELESRAELTFCTFAKVEDIADSTLLGFLAMRFLKSLFLKNSSIF